MFSGRVPSDLQPNRLSVALRRARASGRPLIDLTITNPTQVGLHYPDDLLAPLACPAARRYEPDPRGLAGARAAVAADYARRGIGVATDRVVLTASTSEAYSILFKLLCEPSGNDVLVPTPSYPLFEHLTRLDGVDARPYRLEYHGRWMLDESSVDEAWSPAVRAVLAVSPNNPTGSLVSFGELEWLSSRCAERRAALIVDEVFADYQFIEPVASDVSRKNALTFLLGGLSKSAGLPQVKLGWIVADGPDDLVAAALDRLDLICDTYLSVSTPVQAAAPALIAHGAAARAQILERVRGNYSALRRMAAAHRSVDVLQADGGWSAVMRVPSTRSEEEFVLDLLERRGVVVHPGFFFDFPREAFVIVSLLPEPSAFAAGVNILLEQADA